MVSKKYTVMFSRVSNITFWFLIFAIVDQNVIIGNSLTNFKGSEKTAVSSKAEKDVRTILFFGNSLTAGYGLQKSQAFPALIQDIIDSLGWNFEVINAGLSGETSSGGLRRVDWLLRRKIDVLVLELGANDALRGVSLELTKKNLQANIDLTKKKYPDVKIVIAGMQAPPNLGQIYTSRFSSIFTELAEENDATLIPFLLEDVAGIRRLNQADQIHPTAEGHKILAKNVWETLRPLLEDF